MYICETIMEVLELIEMNIDILFFLMMNNLCYRQCLIVKIL